MVWFTLALFVVSFIATALLAPKPQIENARAAELDPESFPIASENAPIPLVLGKVDFRAPNTVWYGDFEAVAVTEKVKTGLFSKKRVIVGYRYFLGLDLALGLGPGMVLREIFIDDKSIWSGTTSSTVPTDISINEPDFFGGQKNGGGFVGELTFYPGAFDQPIDPYLQSRVGASNVPAYTGISHLVFKKVEIGEQPALKKMSFVLERYPAGLPATTPLGKIGDDYNPADAIYEITTNPWSGLGLDPEFIDLPALETFGNTLKAENNGVSILITSENDGKRVISEILRQADGIAYQDPITGKIIFDLIRKNYVFADLPVFDESSIVKINSISRSSWEEVYSQSKVNFKQRGKESEGVAVAQNTGNIAMFGKIRSTTVAFPFLYDKALANELAARELSQLSVPLFNVTMELNRRAFSLKPGSVFRFSWEEYGITDMIVRVQRFNLGDLLDGKIVVKVLQDSFASKDSVLAVPEDSLFEEVLEGATSIENALALDAPYYIQNAVNVSSKEGEGNMVRSIPDGSGIKIILPKKPSSSAGFFYKLNTFDGDDGVSFSDTREYPGYGLLNAEYNRMYGFETGIDNTSTLTVKNVLGTFTTDNTEEDIRNGETGFLYVDGEWMGYLTATVNMDGTVTFNNVYRGLFGTQVKTHAVDTEVFEYNASHIPLAAPVLEEGETLYYKIFDVDGTAISPDTPFLTSPLGETARRPYRLGDLRLDGQRFPVSVVRTGSSTLTGKARNRQNFQIEFEADTTDVSVFGIQYNLEVYIDGVLNVTLSQDNIDRTGHVIDFGAAGVTGDTGEIRVTTRDNFFLLDSIGYSFLPFDLVTFIETFDFKSNGSQTIVSNTSMNVPYPAGVSDGDLIICIVMCQSDLTIPAGFLLLERQDGPSNRIYVLGRRSDGTESGNLALLQAVSSPFIGQMIAFENNAGVPYFLTDVEGTNTAQTAPFSVGSSTIDFDQSIVLTIMANSLTNTTPTETQLQVESSYTQISPVSVDQNRLGIAYSDKRNVGFNDPAIIWSSDIVGSLNDISYINGAVTKPYDRILFDGATNGFLYRFEPSFVFEDTALTDVAEDADPIAGLQDLSTLENVATQVTLANRPDYVLSSRKGVFITGDHMITGQSPTNAAGTIFARFRTDSASTANLTMLGSFADSDSSRILLSVKNGIAAFGLGDVGTNSFTDLTTTDLRSATDFHTIVGSWNGTDMFLYVDGVEVNSGARAGVVPPETFYVGARHRTGSTDLFYEGDLFAVGFIDRTLTPAEIATLHNYYNLAQTS